MMISYDLQGYVECDDGHIFIPGCQNLQKVPNLSLTNFGNMATCYFKTEKQWYW